MTHPAKLSRLFFAVCLLGILLACVARSPRAQAVSGAESAQPARKELQRQNKSQTTPAYGLYLGVVKSRPDPHMRVQVEIPALNVTEWAQACLPVGNKAAPSLNSGVWVMFEQGDTRRPVWMGMTGN